MKVLYFRVVYYTEIYQQSKLLQASLSDTCSFPLMINWTEKCQMSRRLPNLINIMLMIITNATSSIKYTLLLLIFRNYLVGNYFYASVGICSSIVNYSFNIFKNIFFEQFIVEFVLILKIQGDQNK